MNEELFISSLYHRTILKGKPHIVFTVNHDKINQAVPEERVKIGNQSVLLLQVIEECLKGFAASDLFLA